MKLKDIEYVKDDFSNYLHYIPRFELYYEFPIDALNDNEGITEEIFANRKLQYYLFHSRSLEIITEQTFCVLVYTADLLLARNFLSPSEILAEVLLGAETLCNENSLELLEIYPIIYLDFTELSEYKHFGFPIYKRHYIHIRDTQISIVPLPKDSTVHLPHKKFYKLKVKRK